MSDCVLCDWEFSVDQAPAFTYRAGQSIPLKWTAEGPHPISLTDGIAETARAVAAVTHWAVAHPQQLLLAIGPFEVDTRLRWVSPPF